MEITQATGMKMPKSWSNRSKIPVFRVQTIANLNQCGIGGMARVPKSRKEKAPARGERSERKIKASCLCRAEKAESEEDHTAWLGTARCDGKVSALRWQSQRAAMAKSARRPSLSNRELKGRGQDGSLDIKDRRLATSILPHGKRSR